MEEYLENVKMLVSTLGHKLFDEKRELKPVIKQETFYIKGVRGADAQGEPTSEGFVVFKGSKASVDTVNSISPSFLNFRNSLINKGILNKIGDVYVFSDDYIFSSPSAAAVIVMGRNANGLVEWKMISGKTLKEYEANTQETLLIENL